MPNRIGKGGKAMQEEKVLQCFHCGNKTLMPLKAECKYEDYDPECGLGETYFWYVFLCPVCHKITLEQQYNFSEEMEYNGKPIWHSNILYPEINSEIELPPSVKSTFEAALKVRNIDGSICALSIRRTLEVMCKEKGEVDGSLYQKLKNLSSKGILPDILDEMADILRNLGNSAAHADETEFSDDIVSSMIEFTKIILDYVYVLPNKLATIQKKLSKDVEIKAPVASITAEGIPPVISTT